MKTKLVISTRLSAFAVARTLILLAMACAIAGAFGPAPTAADSTVPNGTGPRAAGAILRVTDPSAFLNPSVYSFSDDADGSSPTTFVDGHFSGTGTVRTVPDSWETWNSATQGTHVMYASDNVFEITFLDEEAAVGVKAEPADFGAYDITIEAFDEEGTSLGANTLTIDGNGGAAFLGLRSYTDQIERVRLTSTNATHGFAFTDLTYGFVGTGENQVYLPLLAR
jgi:hypothetical protein